MLKENNLMQKLFVIYTTSGLKVIVDSYVKLDNGDLSGIRSARSGATGKVTIPADKVAWIEEWDRKPV